MAEKIKQKLQMSYELVIIIVLMIALTAATLAWLPRKIRNASDVKYQNNLIISSLNLDIEFLVYDDNVRDYRSIAKYVDNQLVSGINYDVFMFKMEPGDRQSYRFRVTNLSTTSDVISDVSLRNLFTKATINGVETTNPPEDLTNKLSIFVSAPDVHEIENLKTAIVTGQDGSNEVLFYNDLTIKSSQTIDIDWYIELSTSAGNEFWGYSFGFESIYFSV